MILAGVVETRFAYRQLIGTRDGMSGMIDKSYFDAAYEDETQANAEYQLYMSRSSGSQ